MPAADRRDGRADRRGRDQRVPLALAAAAALLLLTGSSAVPLLDEPVVAVSSTLPAVVQVATPTPSPASVRRARSRAPVVPVHSAGLPPIASRSDRTVPARVVIGDVGIDVVVRPVGVDPDGQMSMPDTVDAAAWYEYGPRPADRVGTTVIAGHVDTRTEGLGPFASLAALGQGSRIVVTDRSGARTVYRITDLTRIGKHQTDLKEVFERSGRPRLQIITCAGAYDPRTGYHDYLIVTAVPV